jgi:hypothetical protein
MDGREPHPKTSVSHEFEGWGRLTTVAFTETAREWSLVVDTDPIPIWGSQTMWNFAFLASRIPYPSCCASNRRRDCDTRHEGFLICWFLIVP